MIRNLLRFLGWVCLLVLLSVGVLGLVYILSERTQKIAIEQRVLNVVDTVREDGTTPRTVVDALDRLADGTEAVKGDIIPAPTPAAVPLEDPPGVRAASNGLVVGPEYPTANSVVTVLPRMIAPPRRRA